MDKERNESLSQDKDQMFERNITILAARQREVKVSNPVDSVIGFLSGLDQASVQIVRTDNQKYVLFSRQGPLLIEETGRTLRALRKENITTENRENVADVIETRIKSFSNKAATLAPRSTNTRGTPPNGFREERQEIQ